MLQALRQQASSWVVKILFAFLILSFGLWGINDIFMGERDPTVATVAGNKITLNQLNEAVRQEISRFAPMFGGTLDREQAKQLGLIDQALDKLVERAVFANAVDTYGLIVNDEMIRRHIQTEPAFRNAGGQFDRNLFQQVLAQNGLNEGSYVAGLRRDLATHQLISAITANTPAPAILLESLHRFREEGRTADIIAVPASEAPTPSVPDESVIADYYKSTIDRFMTPELRAVSIVTVDPSMLMNDSPITDEQLRAEYAARIGQFTTRATRDVDQAVLRSEDEARKVVALLARGRNLEQALKEAESTSRAVKLGPVEKSHLIPEIAEAAFALKAGEHSAPIASSLGWHVLTVNAATAQVVKPFDEVRDALRADLAEYTAAQKAHDLAIRLEDTLVSGATLAEAAERLGLKPVAQPPVSVDGLTADGKPADAMFKDPRVIRAVFTTPQDQESALIELPRNSFAVVRVERIMPPAAKPLDEVRAQVVAAWQDEQRMTATRQRAEAMAERITKGETAATVAAAEKLALKTTPVFTRMSQDSESGLPESVKAQLFDLGGIAFGETREGYVVGVLKETKPAEPLQPEARTQLASQMSQAMGDDLLDQLAATLRARYRVEVRRDIIDRRF